MLWWSILLFLGAVVGNTALWAWCINQLYGTRFRGWWVTLLRLTCQGLVVLAPLAFLVIWGPELLAGPSWLSLPLPLLAYLGLCWILGFGVMPYQTVKRWLRTTPAAQLSNHTATLDVAAQLGRKPYGPCKHRHMAYVPFNEIFQVDFIERTFQLPRLPAPLDGLSILQISDTHLCGCPDRAFYDWVVDRCRAWPVDVVAVTGDILDSEDHYHWIIPVFSRLKWREAAFAILGNHDSWLDVERIQRRMERCGFEMLGGKWKEITLRGEQVIVIGNEVPWLGPTPDLTECPKDRFRLCLSHSPDTLPWARENNLDLVLAGHNHGGQVRFPGIGAVLVPSRCSRRYDCGTFFEEPTLLHVSRGLGGTYPLRWNCRPEVTRIILKASGVA
jgi:hypothetical protein